MNNPPFDLKKTMAFQTSLANIIANPKLAEQSKKEQAISLHASPEDYDLAKRIAVRCTQYGRENGLKPDLNTLMLAMDLIVCHCNGTPLHLLRLMMSDNNDMLHDCLGIGLNLNRTTGKLMNGFKPIFAVQIQ